MKAIVLSKDITGVLFRISKLMEEKDNFSIDDIEKIHITIADLLGGLVVNKKNKYIFLGYISQMIPINDN